MLSASKQRSNERGRNGRTDGRSLPSATCCSFVWRLHTYVHIRTIRSSYLQCSADPNHEWNLVAQYFPLLSVNRSLTSPPAAVLLLAVVAIVNRFGTAAWPGTTLFSRAVCLSKLLFSPPTHYHESCQPRFHHPPIDRGREAVAAGRQHDRPKSLAVNTGPVLTNEYYTTYCCIHFLWLPPPPPPRSFLPHAPILAVELIVE